MFPVKLNTTIIFLLCTILFSACNNGSGTDEEIATDTISRRSHKVNRAQNIFYSVPSPIETATLIQKAGAKYDASLLNPIENLANYNTTSAKALNLGVYGTDLVFTSVFDQTQESMVYLKCTNRLANSLGISGAFDDKTISQVQSNLEQRDTVLQIISRAFWTADLYLKENERPNTSALIIAGGWIEGMYLATQLSAKTSNKEITSRIAEQKSSLENLVGLLKTYSPDNDIDPILVELKKLQNVFSNITFLTKDAKVATDESNKITTIGGKNEVLISEEQLKQITEIVKNLRERIIR